MTESNSHTVEVVDHQGEKLEGTFTVAKGIMILRSGSKKSDAVEVRNTDVQWLAKTVLLELHGKHRTTWPVGWDPVKSNQA